MIEIIKDTLIDSIKLLPFLFITYILMEYIEHKMGKKSKEIIKKSAKETKKLISIEDHNTIGGLGSAISEVLTEIYPKQLIRMGIPDTFGKSGKAEELMKYFKITAEDIVEKMIEI